MIRAPQQSRSHATLARIVRAATELLESSSFDDITVADLAGAARTSVGAFYARFGDKHALLEFLEGEAERAIDAGHAELRRRSPADCELRVFAADLVRVLVRFHRSHRGVLRAVYLRERGGRPLAREPFARHYAAITTTLLGWRRHIRHASPRQAARIGLLMVLGAIGERILFPDAQVDAVPLSDELLIDELARALVGYLRG